MSRQLFGTLLAAIALIAGIAAGTSAAAAQGEATPADEVTVVHPAHIHSGTCEDLGEVVYPLEDVTNAPVPGTPAPSPEPEPSNEGLPGDVIGRSSTIVDVSIEDLLAEEHAINVHESPENIQNYVACGNIEGEAEGGELIITLEQLNSSGITGQAILAPVGDGTTEVTITLTDAEAEIFATPDATPEG